MKTQNYSNHKRYYAPHHFILLPVLGFLIAIGVWKTFTDEEHQLVWTLFSIVIFCILFLAIMLRQHYALGNQNRIVRLEFRLRYFEIFGRSADSVEKQLSFAQIAALRFADNTEFVHLVNLALNKGISGDEIKRSIKNWQADNERV
jgi:Family of unknown function (DUF6526)